MPQIRAVPTIDDGQNELTPAAQSKHENSPVYDGTIRNKDVTMNQILE
jgi:hypothetical protein